MKKKKRKSKPDPVKESKDAISSARKTPGKAKIYLYAFIIAVLTAIAFLPSLANDFADLDDSAYVTNNRDIRGFAPENIKAMFSKGYVGHYCPVTMLSYTLDHHFFKLDPFGYHLTSFILNILVTLMVFYFIYLISKNAYIAFIAGLFFGVHPLHVESVAWIAERKDVLCAFFYMITLILYVYYVQRRNKSLIFLCLFTAVLALLSKPMAVTIPVVFLLIDFLYKRMNFIAVIEKVPFFVLSIAAGLVNIHFQAEAGAMKVLAKGMEAVYFLTMAPLFYLYKMILPFNLSAMYEYYRVSDAQRALIPVFAAVLLTLFAAVIFSLKYSRKIFFACGMSFVMLLPVLKIIPVGDIYAADRYMYLPSIGLLYVVGIFFNFIGREYKKEKLVYTAIVVITAFFMTLTWQRCKIWSDPTVFYEETLKTAPRNQVLLNNLGNVYSRTGKLDEAISTYRRSIKVIPSDPGSHYNLGNALLDNRDIEGAIGAYKEALRLRPGYIDAYKSLARAYYSAGKRKEEIGVYEKIISIDPSDPTSYYNLCLTYRSLKEMSKAAYYCDMAVKNGLKVPPGLISELSAYKE